MTPSHAALLNHAFVVGVTCCHPMPGRYCSVGRELWLQYRAECVKDGGKDAMQCVRAQSPEWADEIKVRALTLIDNGGWKMKKPRTSWERRESARTGKPIDQVLHDLIEASGGKWEVIGAITGMTHQGAVRMFSRNGIVKQPARNIDYEGKTPRCCSIAETTG